MNTQENPVRYPACRQGGRRNVPQALNEVPDLMIVDEDDMMITEANTKRKRDEIARGRRKRQKEDYIQT